MIFTSLFITIFGQRSIMKLKFILMAVCLSYGVVHAQQFAKGVVYNDINKNGKKDRNEKGLESVSVSNGRDVVLTNSKGEYQLPIGDDNIIFVIKPSDYIFPLDNNNLPQYYYIHKPSGSPTLKYNTSKPTGKIPASLDFPLYENKEDTHFRALVFGDPQAYTLDEIAFFKKGIVNELVGTQDFAFGISLGDLVGDDLILHDPYKAAVQEIGVPWYNVMGNHDMNYDVKVDSLSDETFEYHFGPNNYSFNYGNAHFIVLDNIIYPNPRTGKGYLGGFRKDQLDFVENDLKHVSKDKLIVLCFHIPLQHNNSDVFRNEDRQRLFDILAPFNNTVSLSAHTHYQQQLFYDKKDGWRQEKPHHEYNVGTTSGDWYSGEMTPNNTPSSTMRDGTPKGYAIMNVNDNQYSFDYKVANKTKDYQINVIVPSVIKSKYLKQYHVYANFFMGKEGDDVQIKIDNGPWKAMKYDLMADPSYQYEVLKFDNATALKEARRPSNPTLSTHIWSFRLPANLSIGQHVIEVKAKDMYGKVHHQEVNVEVVK